MSLKSDQPKGCLQRIVRIELVEGCSNHFGYIAIITLACQHVIKQFGGKYRGKRMHCEICIEQNAS